MSFITDELQIRTEVIKVSSAKSATQYSQRYDMSNCDRISFIVANGTAQSAITAMPTVTFYKDNTLTGTGTAISSATCDMNSANATASVVTKANAVLIAIATVDTWAAQDLELTIQGVTIKGSTALAGTTWATGATVTYAVGASSADTSSAANALCNLINNSSLYPKLWAVCTAQSAILPTVKVMVKDGESTYITAYTTGGGISVMAANQQAKFDFDPDVLGSRYIWAKVSTLATGVEFAITCIKSVDSCPPDSTADFSLIYKTSAA